MQLFVLVCEAGKNGTLTGKTAHLLPNVCFDAILVTK